MLIALFNCEFSPHSMASAKIYHISKKYLILPFTLFNNNMIRTVAIFFTISTIFIATSCLDGIDENPYPRTPELEESELNEALQKLVAEGYDIDTTNLGIYYIVNEEGEGPLAKAGDTLSLEYTGYFFGGQVFDASAYHYEDSIWKFVFKEMNLIPGFEDGISIMNKGAGIEMIIPSQYAYGAYGYGPVGPYTTILFSAKLHDLEPGVE